VLWSQQHRGRVFLRIGTVGAAAVSPHPFARSRLIRLFAWILRN
jgi:hypothetical protein